MAEADGPEGRKPLIIALGGAFNPVHTQHVAVMEMAKIWIDKNTKYEVIGGCLAVAPDGYVKGKTRKTGQRAMKSEHRIKLCEIACQRCRAWLKPEAKTHGSALQAAKELKEEILRSKDNTHTSIENAVIVGADRAVNAKSAKWMNDKTPKNITLCVGRKGETGPIKERWESDLSEGRVPHPDSFILIPEEADAVSSTEIRKVLNDVHEAEDEAKKKEVIEVLIERNMLDQDMVDYILENESDLYM